MQARINAAAAAGAGTQLTLLKNFCVRTLTSKSANVLFSIFDLPFANSDKIKADLAGQTFHKSRK